MTTVLPSREGMIRAVSWYDNEWGYASRIADLASFASAYSNDAYRLECASGREIGSLDR